MTEISFFCGGKAAPGGSKNFAVNRRTGKMFMKDACKYNPEWRKDVALAARQAFKGPLLEKGITIIFTFLLARPKHHYRTGKNSHLLRDNAPDLPLGKPDTTKLVRAAEDALTGVVWADDAQIHTQLASKRYCVGVDKPGAWLYITDEPHELMQMG